LPGAGRHRDDVAVTHVSRGRLRPATEAPATGEWTGAITSVAGAAVSQILSGTLSGPADYDQEHDEWALVVTGGAVLVVEGERLELGPGDWVVLPAHVRHRLAETRPGTSWVTVSGSSVRGS
jgi:cupin 2 domain-containing protein